MPSSNRASFGRLLATGLLLLVAAGCTRGKSQSEKDEASEKGEAKVEAITPAAAPVVNSSLEDWRVGRLPPLEGQGQPVPGGEVVVQASGEPPSLNTIVDSDLLATRISHRTVYQSLLGIDAYDDPRYRHTPELATSWDISDDRLTHTFHLRRGVKFHDGMPFTSKDVVATFEKILDEETKAAHMRSYLEELESFRAIDDFTVVFVWKKPYFMALDDPFAFAPIQPAHVIAKLSGTDYNKAATNPLNRAPVGTGPFVFREWKSDERIILARNESYWGRKAHLERLVFRIVKDPTMGPMLAEKGELDVVTANLAETWVEMEKRPALVENYHRSLSHEAAYSWLGWNQERPFFQDRKVRRALTLLIDRAAFRKSVLHDLSTPTTCHFYFKSAACDPGVERLPHDPIAATKLLEEAGWKDSDGDGIRERKGVSFSFTLMIPAFSVALERLATLMKEAFGRAGIMLSIQKVEWSAMNKRLREHEFDACALVWGGGPRSEPTQIWHSNSIEGGSNYISFRHAEADAIIEAARIEFDEEKRNALYRKFHRILHEEQPYTFLWVPTRRTLIHKRIRGAQASLAYWQFADWWLPPKDG